MKRLLAILTLVTVFGIMSATGVLAAGSGPPAQDGWVDINAPTVINNTVNLWARGSTTACTPTNRTYLKWDLTGVTSTIANATITLNINGLSGDFPNPHNITLYQVTNDAWDETTLTWNNSPTIGSAIQTQTVTVVGQVIFNDPLLAAFLDAQAKGDHVASFAIDMTGNCTAGSVGARFDSKEATTGAKPNLSISNPNAVDMSTASAQQSSWLLYAGLAAVALVVVAGVTISRRKTA